MRITGLDHIVLCVADVERALRFYERVLGLEAREERPGKWSLFFGAQKISVQDARSVPAIAKDTAPGSGNFCLLTDVPMQEVVAHLQGEHVAIVEGPAERIGATCQLLSVYFNDPDGNLVEVSNRLPC
jgi:catechol 2,3-dioxygenase-like lactoylglutathione lyase family enzyme